MSDLTASAAMLGRRLRELAPPGELTQSKGATVAGLLAAERVTGEPDPHDGRKTRYLPTKSNRTVIYAESRDDWLVRALEARLKPAEQQQLTDVFPLLQQFTDY